MTEIRNASGWKHLYKVLGSAMKSANKYERAICAMYDLSRMLSSKEDILLMDAKELAQRYSLFEHAKNPSY